MNYGVIEWNTDNLKEPSRGKTESAQKTLSIKQYAKNHFQTQQANHGTEVVSNSCEVEGEHPEKIKELPKPINIPAKNLFTIAPSNFALKNSNLIEPNISALANL